MYGDDVMHSDDVIYGDNVMYGDNAIYHMSIEIYSLIWLCVIIVPN